MQERHPVLDAAGHRRVEQRLLQGREIDQLLLSGGRLRPRRHRVDPRQRHLRRHRVVVRRQRPAQPGGQPLDLVGRDPGRLPRGPDDRLVLADDHRPVHRHRGIAPAGQHDHRHDVARHQPVLRDELLDRGRHPRQRVQLVVRGGVTAVEPPTAHAGFGPGLDVDHQHAARTDRDHVDVRRAGTRPPPVDQQLSAPLVHRAQECGDPALGAGRHRVPVADVLLEPRRLAVSLGAHRRDPRLPVRRPDHACSISAAIPFRGPSARVTSASPFAPGDGIPDSASRTRSPRPAAGTSLVVRRSGRYVPPGPVDQSRRTRPSGVEPPRRIELRTYS